RASGMPTFIPFKINKLYKQPHQQSKKLPNAEQDLAWRAKSHEFRKLRSLAKIPYSERSTHHLVLQVKDHELGINKKTAAAVFFIRYTLPTWRCR
ncbi:hypothetical protein ACOKR8_07135, partial [Vibrio cholerae]